MASHKQTNNRLASVKPGATIVLIGASQRMLVPSAIRAGYRPVVVDLFADWDTGQWRFSGESVKCIALSSFSEIKEIDLNALADVAILCGGVERRLELVRAIEDQVPLLGTPASKLHRFSKMSELLEEVRAVGFCVPDDFGGELSNKVHWLRKNESACGGFHIETVDSNDVKIAKSNSDQSYIQPRVVGPSFAALFETNQHSTGLVGVTHQLVGLDWLTNHDFGYCGSVGPCSKLLRSTQVESRNGTVSLQKHLLNLGEFVGAHLGLRGLWGCDFILSSQGGRKQLVVLDLNPRIPASAELFDAEQSVVARHIQACLGDSSYPATDSNCKDNERGWIEGKAILYNRTDTPIQITASVFGRLAKRFDQAFYGSTENGMTLADIPNVNTEIAPCHPILTIRIRERNTFENGQVGLMQQLRKAARDVEEALD